VVQTIFAFIVPAVLAAWLFSLDTFGYLKAKTWPSSVSFALLLVLMLVAIPFLNAVTALNAGFNLPESMDKVEQFIVGLEESAIRLTELFTSMENSGELAFNLFMIAVLPAIGEELLFRGVLQNLFIEWSKNKHIGIFLSAFVFSFFHLQFFGFLPRLLLGIYLGYLLVISGSIWLPVAGHFINNALIIIYYYFTSEPAGETFLEKIGTERGTFFIAAVSLLLTTLMFMLINRNEKKESII
jgi:membrane protease YdiL (CAAX protease family)